MSQPYKEVISKYGKWHSQRQAIRLWLTRSEPYCFLPVIDRIFVPRQLSAYHENVRRCRTMRKQKYHIP